MNNSKWPLFSAAACGALVVVVGTWQAQYEQIPHQTTQRPIWPNYNIDDGAADQRPSLPPPSENARLQEELKILSRIASGYSTLATTGGSLTADWLAEIQRFARDLDAIQTPDIHYSAERVIEVGNALIAEKFDRQSTSGSASPREMRPPNIEGFSGEAPSPWQDPDTRD